MNRGRYLFFIFLLFIFKIFALNQTSFSLFGDEAQYWLWSKNLDFGYFSKPPLIAWFIRLYSEIFGNSFPALKSFSVVFYFFSAFALYVFCKNLRLSKDLSFICSVSFLVIPAVSVSSFIISTDVILIFFWILSLNILLLIKKNPSKLNFVLFGCVLGLAFLSKYAAIYFLICLVMFLFFDKNIKNIFFKNLSGTLIFLFTVVLLLTPNFLWNVNNGWVTMFHTSDNINLKNININFIRGMEFLLIQSIMVGPILFFGFLFSIKKINLDSENIFLLCFSIPVFIIVLVESILVRANANWAAPALVSFLVFMLRSVNSSKKPLIYLNFYTNLVFAVFLFIAISASIPLKIFDRINGIKEFSNNIIKINKTKNLVVSDRLLFSNLSYELRNLDQTIRMPHSPKTKIINHFQLSRPLNKKTKEGFLLVGSPEDILYLNNTFNLKHIKNFKEVFSNKAIEVYEVTF